MNPAKKPTIQKRSITSRGTDAVKEAELKAKAISKKKVLFTEIDDEITGIYDKLKKYKMRNIYIVVPKRAILFQSIVNLRILKRKSEDLGKTIYIITNDLNGMQLAERAGFTVFDKLEGNEHPSLVSGKLPDDQIHITPLEASINTYEDDTPTRLKAKKLSIAELIRRTKKTETQQEKPISQNRKKRVKEKTRFVLVSPNRQALTILTTITILILFLIIYIALPGATIYLTPKANTLSVSANITLADAVRNKSYLETHPQNVIASYPVETTVNKQITYFTTGTKFEGKNATGTITIINTSGRDWPLVEQTRFQTSDGLVFRIQKGLTVPAASVAGPGKLDTFVVADEIDAFGNVIGEKGNIGPSKFFLPGLSEENRKNLSGESSSDFTGGLTISHKMVSRDDLDAAKGRMEAELRSSAEEELKNAVMRMNQEQNLQLTLLVGYNAIKLGDPVVTVPDGLEGRMLEQFELTGTLTASGTAYNNNEMANILIARLKLSKSPEKRLIRIDSESITYRLIPIEPGADPTRQKITATIKGVEQYEIDPDKENGKRLIDNIKSHILGKSIQEAEVYIQQLPSINKVRITSWPAWSPTIPSVPDNIKIEIREEM